MDTKSPFAVPRSRRGTARRLVRRGLYSRHVTTSVDASKLERLWCPVSLVASGLFLGCGGSADHGSMNTPDGAAGDAACSLPSFDPATCSPDDLSTVPIVHQTFTMTPAPTPNNLTIPPGTYQITATTAYCPPGSAGYPMARYKQGVATFAPCSIKVTFRGGDTQADVQTQTPFAGILEYAGTQGTSVCPTQNGGLPKTASLAWTVAGNAVVIPNAETISVTLSDGGAGTCESVDTVQKM
jgi:hypothetical protein